MLPFFLSSGPSPPCRERRDTPDLAVSDVLIMHRDAAREAHSGLGPDLSYSLWSVQDVGASNCCLCPLKDGRDQAGSVPPGMHIHIINSSFPLSGIRVRARRAGSRNLMLDGRVYWMVLARWPKPQTTVKTTASVLCLVIKANLCMRSLSFL